MLEQLIETQRLANELLDEFGLKEQGWTFRYGNTKAFVGRCFHNQKVIEVSKWYVTNSADEIEDTIRHEIAHALVGSDHGHDHVWRRAAIECGAKPFSCADASVKFNGNYNYLLICEGCGKKWRRHRMKLKNPQCPTCNRKLLINELKTGEFYYLGG